MFNFSKVVEVENFENTCNAFSLGKISYDLDLINKLRGKIALCAYFLCTSIFKRSNYQL
ncbi:hypothetical protein [Peptoniphilus stercorisuis]|uniref:Uncharacterized protein n=1 Tax=Peptoniphilus stercorisuis TaxID=1436965 RepID=A0ABS4KF65_9FIRM|nr:hypothetical protein [Peptoniphilus stercorisuis]MBP2026025.1 hypothetical protein [Peptoniphilus stercorisuis]